MRTIIIYGIIFLSILFTHKVQAQVFANVDLNRKTVYVQQPFHVTITVYTKTWFTAPLEFGNLQIPNAFIVPFDATQPGMFTIDGKQYPGIQFYYIVFPYKAGDFTVPSLQLTAQSPPEGSSQSRKIELQTTPQPFTVKDVPAELKKKSSWFVAKGVDIREEWKPALKDLKTGDVIKRTITIEAKGTLPQFIPNLSMQENLKWAASYPQDPVLTDTRGNGDANGRSVQTITYLFEKAGDFTIAGINLSFWNPVSSKIENKSTRTTKIHISENPNLGILTTIKDSLDATITNKKDGTSGKSPFLIFGMKWYSFAGCVIAGALILFILIKIGRYLYKTFRSKYKDYQKSEAYLFKKFQQSNNDPKSFLTSLYKWWDSIPEKFSASIGSTLEKGEKQDESKLFKDYFGKVIQNKEANESGDIKNSMKDLRKEVSKKKKSKYNYLFHK